MSGERVEWISGEGVFADLAAAWRALAETIGALFGRPEWYAAWWEAFGDGELETLCIFRDDALVAVVPFSRRGRTLRALSNVHTPTFGPLAADHAATALVLAAVRSAAAEVGFASVPVGPRGSDQLVTAARAAGLVLLLRNAHVSPLVDTTGAFEDWRRETKPRWHAPLDRYRRKMVRDLGADIRVVAPPEDLTTELETGLALQLAGWKGRQATAILSREDTARFYRRIVADFHALGLTRFSSIIVDGRPIAWEFQLLHQNRLWGMNGAIDEGFKKFSPGLVLKLALIERCFALGLDAYEFIGGDEDWKGKFATARRAHVDIELYRPAPVPLAHFAARRSGQVAVRALRRAQAARASGDNV